MIPDTEAKINKDDARKFQKCLTYLKMMMFKKFTTMLNYQNDGMNNTVKCSNVNGFKRLISIKNSLVKIYVLISYLKFKRYT